MRRAPTSESTVIPIPDHWLTKVSVGQVMSVGQYPAQKKYEIVSINRTDKLVKVKPITN